MTELIILLIAIPVVLLVAGFGFLRSRASSRKSEVRSQIKDLRAQSEPAPINAARSVEEDISGGDAEVGVQDEAESSKPASFRERLSKARAGLSQAVGSVFSSDISDETWETLEEALIRSDVGIGTTTTMVSQLKKDAEANSITDPAELQARLAELMAEELADSDRTLKSSTDATTVWMFVGVNGVGKTTTIGKIANAEIQQGSKVLLAAGDTFRAAAAEQLGMWADRSGAGIVKGGEGSDPASVVFDAIEAATARGADLVLADTAGRLQNKSNLMDELSKISRVAQKASGEVTEVLLVLDATTGQNGLSQAKVFSEVVGVTGVVLTKLDGSAKGGIVFAIESELGIPVKMVGLGEGISDLVPFEPAEFVEALVS